jgi:DNA polymerase-3 subunit delta'
LTPLNDIIGQDITKKIILNAINRGRLASTYLFSGDDGSGKWQMAIALAALTNCEQPIKNDDDKIIDACGECRNCRQILRLNFPELLFALPLTPHRSSAEAVDLTLAYLDEKREQPYKIIRSARQMTIPINSVREIKRKTAIKPPAGTTRIILIYQMDKMLHASADSLLKLIEEPPPETIIILTVDDPESLLPTIRSRSQMITFRPVPIDELTKHLIDNYRLPEERAALYARLAAGSPGRALGFETDENTSALRQTSFLVFKQIFLKDNPSAVGIVNEFISPNNRGEAEQILSYWQSFLGDITILKYGTDDSAIVNIDLKPELEKLSLLAISVNNLDQILKSLKKSILAMGRNVHLRPALTSLVLDIKNYIGQFS